MKGVLTEFVEPRRLETKTPLVIDYLPGTGSRLVISLAGVGKSRGAVPPPEFMGTASAYGANHVLLVSDPNRCWMNNPGYDAELVDIIENCVTRNDIEHVVAMGNSMGASMALILADLMDIDVVIAFTPQFSAHPDIVPEEWRWMFFREKIEDWLYPDVGSLSAPNTVYYLIHGDTEDEQWHWQRFPWRPQINHLILEKMDHALARRMQKRQLLSHVVTAAIHNKPKVLRRQLGRDLLGRTITPHRREHYQKQFNTIELDMTGAPVVVPGPTEG